MQLFYSDHFPLPLPAGHRFPMAKYRMLRDRIVESEELSECELLTPEAATDQQLRTVHTQSYISKVVNGEFTDVELRRLGFPWSEQMVERSRRSTGASIAAARSALRHGISGNLAGGTHHAFPDSGQGYCVFNDVCVAARVMQKENRIGSALIIDCDVHQGNGTSAITKDDASIFSFSMHCNSNYPFRKTDGDLDAELDENCEDDVYLGTLRESLVDIERSFCPDLVFYLAGADPFENDRLGKLNVTRQGLEQRDHIVFSHCLERGIPVAFCMAGGYAEDVREIADIHFRTVRVAWKYFEKIQNAKFAENPGEN